MEKPKNIDEIIQSSSFEKYGLNFVGIGAENICFEVAGSSKKLIKVNVHVLRRKLLELLEDSPSSNLEQEENIEEYRKQEDDIREVFGDEHLLDRGVFRKKIPLTKSIIASILGEQHQNLTNKLDESKSYEIEMLIHTQLIAEELKDSETYQTKDYSTDLMTHNDFIGSRNVDGAIKKVEDLVARNFIEEMGKMLADDRYSEIIKEITEKIIQYTKSTGLMLDIFGQDNITIFTNKDGKIDFHLLDVIPPGNAEYWKKTLGEDKKLELLRHAYTFYYSVNSLAKRLGIKNNLDLDDMLYFKGSVMPTGDWPFNSR